MSSFNTSCGPTSPAFFVGRTEILNWINNTLQLNPPIQKIEETSNGAVWCQLCHIIWPETPIHRVSWNARTEIDKINNFKILQETLKRKNIDNHVPIQALITGKFQENLAFAQIMKYILEPLASSNLQTYNPVAERMNSKRRNPVSFTERSSTFERAPAARPEATSPNVSQYLQKIAELEAQLFETQNAHHIAESEKMFYYEKLLAVEAVIQDERFLGEVPVLVEEINRVLAADGESQ